MQVESVKKVYDDGTHNAFTDIAWFKDKLYLAFRSSPQGHSVNFTSSIVVLQSSNGEEWTKAATFQVPGRDLRDPHIVNSGDRLFLYSGAWAHSPTDVGVETAYATMSGYVMSSNDGTHWDGPSKLDAPDGLYYWQGGFRDGVWYLTAKRYHTSDGRRTGCDAVLFSSKDGYSFRELSTMVPQEGNEAALQFEDSGRIVGISRNNFSQGAVLCMADPPYRDWSRRMLEYNVGGPLLFSVPTHNGPVYIVAGRRIRGDEARVTSLFQLKENSLVEIAVLPSGGDTSYPGFVRLGESSGLLSYYSSHEVGGDKLRANIYLAHLKW